jgi:protease IV
MKKFLLVSLALVGALSILTTVALAAMAIVFWSARPTVPAAVVLELRLDEPLQELDESNPLTALGGRKETLRDVVDALERAGEDARVKGLIAHIAASPGSPAAAQELRDAVKGFRAKGKKTVAFADSFGEFTGGSGPYYLAAAFEEVYLQPSGDVGITGVASEAPFLRDALDKLDVKPQFGKRYEYKNAVNVFTERTYDRPHREATETLLGSIFQRMVSDIAADRNVSEEQLRQAVDRAPIFGKESMDAKLVDGLAYRDEVYAKVKDGWGKDAELLYLHRYLERVGRPHESGDRVVALVYGVGPVTRGKSEFGPLFGGATFGSDSVAAAFRSAVEDERVEAILFRVDSPGGSYVASDTVRREVQRAREKGKPVVVSMGNVAASGGYFVSMDADRIVAQPGTLTGSIGVYAGKFVTTGLWDKLGINWESVAFGKNATLFNTDQEFSPEQRAKVDAELDRIYEDFTSRAAAARKLPLEKLQAAAKGRVWTGADAQQLGLVDELGGFSTALRLARELAEIPAEALVRVQVFPRPKRPLEALIAALAEDGGGDNSDEEGAWARASGARPLFRQARAIQAFAERLGLTQSAGALTAPLPAIADP